VKATATPTAPADLTRSLVNFDPIQPLRAHEYVAEQIRRHIALRLVGPGQSLPPERELVELFGVGRPTVQLALRTLEAEGLIQARRGRHGGTFVRGTTEGQDADELFARLGRRDAEIEELLILRRHIEPLVTRLAARSRTRADLALMHESLAEMQGTSTDADYMRCDTAFHLAVAGASGNRYLVSDVELIRVELNDAFSLLPESEAWHKRITEEHDAIYDAISARDEDGAEEFAQIHVANSERGVRAALAAMKRRTPELRRKGA
jgi:GntR family transcriptional repressor for pyruvate dehydrogenase complex